MTEADLRKVELAIYKELITDKYLPGASLKLSMFIVAESIGKNRRWTRVMASRHLARRIGISKVHIMRLLDILRKKEIIVKRTVKEPRGNMYQYGIDPYIIKVALNIEPDEVTPTIKLTKE